MVVEPVYLLILIAAAMLAYWLGKTPAERVAAVETLRRQYYGNSARLQRVTRVIKRAPR